MSNNIEEIVSLIDDVRFRSGGQDEPHLFNPSGAMHGFQVCFQRIERQSVKRCKALLHQASASTLRQLCDDASDSVLIATKGVTPEWGFNTFPRAESLASSQSCRSVDSDTWCKWALNKELCYVYQHALLLLAMQFHFQ